MAVFRGTRSGFAVSRTLHAAPCSWAVLLTNRGLGPILRGGLFRLCAGFGWKGVMGAPPRLPSGWTLSLALMQRQYRQQLLFSFRLAVGGGPLWWPRQFLLTLNYFMVGVFAGCADRPSALVSRRR